MLSWRALAHQRLRWKRGAFEDLLSFGLTKHTLMGWTLQVVAFTGILVTLVYFGTLVVSPWIGFHVHPLFVALTGVYAIERAITVRSRGWKTAFASLIVFVEWFYDLFLQAVQIRALWGAVWKTSKTWLEGGEISMYSKLAVAPGAIAGSALAVTGLNLVYSGLVAFVLIGAGFAVSRCLPKRHTS